MKPTISFLKEDPVKANPVYTRDIAARTNGVSRREKECPLQ